MSGTPGLVSLISVCDRLFSMPSHATRRWNGRKSCRNRLPSVRASRASMKPAERRLVLRVGVDPAAFDLRFAHRLRHVGLDAIAVGGESIVRQRREGPGPDQRLVEQVLVVAGRRALALDRALAAAVQAAPAPQSQPPCRRQLRERVDARAHVLGALAVVGGGGEHRVRPLRRAILTRAVKGGHGEAEAGRVAADLVQRDQPVVDVERRCPRRPWP